MSTTTDTLFAPLTVATAPEASRPMLEKVQKSLGFIPNLMAAFANNPTVLEGYLALGAGTLPQSRQCRVDSSTHGEFALARYLSKDQQLRLLLILSKVWPSLCFCLSPV